MADRDATPERGSVSRDREILCILFDATNNAKKGETIFRPGDNITILQDGWKLKDGWESGMAMGEWHGVTTNAEGRVIGLDLRHNDLKGIIPPQLGDLDALEQLNLGANLLEGIIPPQLGNLDALEQLNLGTNKLTGIIPPQLGNLDALEQLNLRINNLTGIIPPQLGDLDALEQLNLSENSLTGGIPKELGKLQALERLYVSWNYGLGGVIPSELGGLKALKVLSLVDCGLEGGIPSWLAKLQALTKLELWGNDSLGGVIPSELGGLKALEVLQLEDCGLDGGIPSELGKLQSLKMLYLGSNDSLGGVIPPELGDLKALEVLMLGQCGLEGGIPSELGKLQALKRLYLRKNDSLGGVIPPELGELKALEMLNLAKCGLEGGIPSWLAKLQALTELDLWGNDSLGGVIPPELGGLKALKKLNLSNCALEGLWDHTKGASLGQGAHGTPGRCIPSQLRRLLELLWHVQGIGNLSLKDNPWAEPPEAVMSLGMSNVVAYFDALYSSPCKVRRNSVKVVLVGQEGAGKTSLCRSMKAGRATRTDGSAESTVYADVETMELGGASVRVYDCAGQVAYTGLLQMFLTPRAVCVVVCDAEAFGQHGGGADGNIEEDIRKLETLCVCDWLRSISYRVPRNDVILVATKCDLAGGNAAGIAQRMGAACQEWLQRWVRVGMTPVRLEDGVCRTSCYANVFHRTEAAFGKFLSSFVFGHEEAASGNRTGGLDWECDWCDDEAAEPTTGMLHRVMNKRDGSGLRGSEMVLPHSWDIALTVLEALENGRDPVEAVVQRSAEPRVEVERKTELFKGITVEELNAKWEAAVVELSKKGIDVMNRGHALEGALSIREFDGTVVRHETFVFLDVVWLTRILKPLLNHKEYKCHDGSVILDETSDTHIKLTDIEHIDSWNRLKEEGVLEPALAHVMWPDLSEYVLPTLASLGLTFPLELDDAEGLVVLLRLGKKQPKSIGEDIEEFRSDHLEVLDVRWKFCGGVPPGAIEKVLTRCCSIGTVQTFWRFGVLVKGTLDGSEGNGSFALVLEYSPDSNELGMKVYGNICTTAPWGALAYAISTVRIIMVDFPGLRSQAYLLCPHRNHQAQMTIRTSGPGEELLQGLGCSRCSRETGGIGAVAFELVRLVDVREARGVAFCKVNAWFVDVQRKYDVLRPAGWHDLDSETFSSQQRQAYEESLWKQMQEFLKSVLSSAGAPAGIGHRKEDELCLRLETLQCTVDEILRQSRGLEAGMGRVEANMGGVGARMGGVEAKLEGVEANMGGVEATMGGVEANMGGVEARMGGVEASIEGVEANMGGVEAKMGGVEARMGGVAAKISEMAADMMAADDGVTEILDVVVTMLMALRADTVDTPRQACILPGDYAPHGLTDELRSPKVWTQRLEEWIKSDFKAGKGVWKKKMRLFLVCAHTHELVPCGHDGRGYDVQRFRRWVGLAVDVAKFALQVTCTILAGPLVAQLPATTLGAVGEEAFGAAISRIEGQLEGLVLHDEDGAAGVPREEVETLKGKAYNSLRTFVHEMEDTARLQNSAAGKKARRKGTAPRSNSDFVYFENVMRKVQARTGDGEAQWVLQGHKKAWLDATK